MNISMMWLTKIAKIEIPPAVFTKHIIVWIHLWFSTWTNDIIRIMWSFLYFPFCVSWGDVCVSRDKCQIMHLQSSRPLQLHLQHASQHGLWITLSWIIYCYETRYHSITNQLYFQITLSSSCTNRHIIIIKYVIKHFIWNKPINIHSHKYV